MPVANPDGYDYTFTEGNRLWRKNLRDNNGDGQITVVDGVDLNRNFAYKWGYDNEGSSPDPSSDTYRGPAPNSEPETRALDGLFRRVGFEFFINYHSAAELLLYGIGWQVSTPSPDDVIYKAMVGDDANPAVPGYDPDISAELYTTNGDTDTYMTVKYGTLGFTPEMTTCETASASVPDDEWLPEDCVSEFIFPDDEELIQAEFEKNIPFALADRAVGARPGRPGVGRRPDHAGLRHRPVRRLVRAEAAGRGRSPGGRCATCGCTTRSTAAGRARSASASGAAASGTATPTTTTTPSCAARSPGPGRATRSRSGSPAASAARARWRATRFTYTVNADIGGDVLVLAMEDVTGAEPGAGRDQRQVRRRARAALTAAGCTSDVYDFDTRAARRRTISACCRTTRPWSGRPATTSSCGRRARSAARRRRRRWRPSSPSATTSTRAARLLVSGKYALLRPGRQRRVRLQPGSPPPECTDAERYPPACRCSTTSCSTAWARTTTSTTAGTDPDGDPYPLTGVGGAVRPGWSGDAQRARLGREPGPHGVVPAAVERPAAGGVPVVRPEHGAGRLGPARVRRRSSRSTATGTPSAAAATRTTSG